MKKLLVLLMIMVMVLSLAACGGDKEEALTGWAYIEDKGTLIVGLDDTFAPMGFRDEAGNLVGFDIDLANAVAAKLGVEVVFQPIDWNTKEAKLEDGTIDLVWNGMTITPERSAQMCVSVPYLYNKQVAVILKSDAAKFTSKDSMKDAIMTAEKGSAGESVINKK